MGFLDKAKKLAEQAQSKLDDVQAQFNERQSAGSPSGSPAVEYDKHGRPAATPPQETTTPPHGDPLAGAPPQPLQEPDPLPDDSAPARPAPAPPPAAAPAPPPADDPNQPPRMTSGDPLAG
jgi:hypothetical protein